MINPEDAFWPHVGNDPLYLAILILEKVCLQAFK